MTFLSECAIRDHQHNTKRVWKRTHDSLGTETVKTVCDADGCEWWRIDYQENRQTTLGDL